MWRVPARSGWPVAPVCCAPPTRCGLEFFGVDHVLFASDCPFDPEKGPGFIRETIRVLDGLDVSDEVRAQIYEGNARRMLRLRL